MRGGEERGNTEKEEEEEQGVALRYRCDRCAVAVKKQVEKEEGEATTPCHRVSVVLHSPRSGLCALKYRLFEYQPLLNLKQ